MHVLTLVRNLAGSLRVLKDPRRISPQILTGSCKETILQGSWRSWQGSLAGWSLVPRILSFKDPCKNPYRILQGNNPSRILEILARILGRMIISTKDFYPSRILAKILTGSCKETILQGSWRSWQGSLAG